MAACRDDVKTLCPGTKGPERRKCLVDNEAKLSPACAAARADVAAKAKALRQACAADARSLCASAKGKGGGSVVRCLEANTDKLTPDCATAVRAGSAKVQ